MKIDMILNIFKNNCCKINSFEISVIVQGAVSSEYTKDVLLSIRKSLPDSEIILSTWKNSEIEGFDYDILVENDDPGAEILHPPHNQFHNLNRQIISTKNGIKQASKKYVLKTRTDIKLLGNGFLDYFKLHTARCEKYKFLRERVLICQNYARVPEVFPFHIGDWVFFGYKDDIQNIWDIPICPEPETTKWFYNHKLQPEHLNNGLYSHFRHRYCAEQYIWMSFLRKYICLNFEQMFDKSPENTKITEISFANNLVILSAKQYCIAFLKGFSIDQNDIYTYNTWQILYKKYCDNNYEIKINEKRYALNTVKLVNSIKLNFKKMLTPCVHIYKWIKSIATFCIKLFRLLIHLILYEYEEFIYDKDEIKYLKKIIHTIKIQGAKNKNIILLTVHFGEAYVFANMYHQIIDSIGDCVFATCYSGAKKVFDLYNINCLYCVFIKPRQLQNSTYFIGDKKIGASVHVVEKRKKV
jgi:hypothetical protein